MSLYLTIFEGDTEVEGWVLGHYSDFGYFRKVIAAKLDAPMFPMLMSHSDCDGDWPPSELQQLKAELQLIAARFQELPPEQPQGAFQHTKEFRQDARSLYDCFHNVDGENLFEALVDLCDEGMLRGAAILFQ